MLWLHASVLSFIAFGYITTAPAMLLAGAFSSEINYLIRLAEMGIVLTILLLSIPRMRLAHHNLLPILFFLPIYGVRLINDVVFENILMGDQTPTYALGYFFGLAFLPVFSLALLYRPEYTHACYRSFLTLLIAANVLLALYALLRGEPSQGGAFSGRVEEKGEIEGTAALGPIWFGVAGATLMSMLFGIYVSRRPLSRIEWVIGAALAGVCAANILFGASRGPVLALTLSIILFLLSPRNMKGPLKEFVSRGKGWLAVFWGIGIVLILIASSDGNVFLIDRFVDMYSDRMLGATEARDVIYAVAWEDFLSSPLIGRSYVVSFENSLAHNLILESLMSTGVVGSLFFFWALIHAFTAIGRLLDGMRGAEGVSLALATVCQLVAGLSSSSIGQSPETWILMALVTVMGGNDPTPQRQMAQRRGVLR